MNIAKRMYCRVFQFCFKVAIPLLPYRNPKILNEVTEIPAVLKEKGIQSVLLVTDKSIRGLGITRRLEDALKDNEISLAVYDQVVANPTTDNVEEARQLYVDHKCNALIGYGGGSSMDCAKAVGARIAKPNTSLAKMAGILKVKKKIPLLFAIPTTAGTGSETTVAAVVTDAKTRHKYAVSDFPLIPYYAVLDPESTRTLPPSITASTGVDVLVHAVESYIGNSTTKKTREQGLEACKLVFENLEKAYHNGNDMEARRNMLRASYLGGCAFTVSYVGYGHAVAHSLGGKYNTPHGLANAVLIPYVLDAYGTKIYKKLKKLGIAAGVCNEEMSEEEAGPIFIQAIRDLNMRLGIGTSLQGIKEEDIEILSHYADEEGNPVYPVPTLMDAKELQKFYRAVMEK